MAKVTKMSNMTKH